MYLKKIISCALVVAAMAFASCGSGRHDAVKVADKFMKAWVVEGDYGKMRMYAIQDAERMINRMQEEESADDIAAMRKQVKAMKNKFELLEDRSIMGSSCVQLTYKVGFGPDYKNTGTAQLELLRLRNKWFVSIYVM